MESKVQKAADKKAGMYLYYFDICLRLEREKASSKEARLLLKTHPNFVVGFYTRDTSRKIILDDAAFAKDLLLKKEAA